MDPACIHLFPQIHSSQADTTKVIINTEMQGLEDVVTSAFIEVTETVGSTVPKL